MAEIPEYGVTGTECAACLACVACAGTPTPDLEFFLVSLISL
ncbi:MAG: hypothetical protein QMD22_00420 [archaeon]|nr:hypothetical protein [archaeon]